MSDYSPAFLAQLPKSGEMQIDNPTSPLQVLYSILNQNEDDTGEESGDSGIERRVGKEERHRRERTAGRVMALVSTSPHPDPIRKRIELMTVIQYRQPSLTHSKTPIPPFHPPTLTPSFIPLTTSKTPEPTQNPLHHLYQGEE